MKDREDKLLSSTIKILLFIDSKLFYTFFQNKKIDIIKSIMLNVILGLLLAEIQDKKDECTK